MAISSPWTIYAVFFPLSAILCIAAVDFFTGWIHWQSPEAMHSSLNLSIKVSLPVIILLFVLVQWILTALINLITEELTFRRYIVTRFWNPEIWKAVLFASIIFGLWHIPVAILIIKSGWLRVILYAVNITLLGIGFGWLFIRSESLVTPCLAHGLWNSLEYTFWGMGNHKGVFTGNQRVLFDPEEGAAGTIVLLIFAVVFMIKLRK
ncbi:MAG: CPBP family intramembrane glutamic endopeptidase [bacterium]